jgi:hypothetical protein
MAARNSDEALVPPVVGSGESAFGWSLESDGPFCVGAFGIHLASVAAKMFSHVICFIKKCDECSFRAICKANAAVNYYF